MDPETRLIVRLFNPRTDRWSDHFEWAGARLIGRTPLGRATVRTLFMNDPFEIAARQGLLEEGVL
jgi:hypothetical protein